MVVMVAVGILLKLVELDKEIHQELVNFMKLVEHYILVVVEELLILQPKPEFYHPYMIV